jgi:predicted metal-binding membrane protein
MAKPNHPAVSNLSPAATWHGRILAQPRMLAILSLALLAAAGWLYLGFMIGADARAGHRPGASLDLFAGGRVDAVGRALFEALCQPTFGETPAGMPGTGGAAGVAMLALMWAAMTFAMMLPTAAPMALAYADIAETAAAKHEPVVSPLVLTAGFVTVWLGFAALAAALQWALTRFALVDPAMATASGLFSGAIFIGAGAYQFSALKHACLTLCQRPFPFFLANWSSAPAQVFRLGLRQGLYCLGCCWAMMLVMFAVGVMNVVWMAALGVIMGLEKVMVTTRFSRAVGVVLVAIGAMFIVASVMAHWPG